MSSIFNRSIIAPALAAVAAFTAGFAIADEAPPVPKRVQTQQQAAVQGGNASDPCAAAAQSAYQAGMRHGGREMHGRMMEDHKMGPGGSPGTQMSPGGSGGMQMGPGGMPMGGAPGGMQMGCSGKPGCTEGMPKGSSGKSGSTAPGASNSPMPMTMPMEGHM